MSNEPASAIKNLCIWKKKAIFALRLEMMKSKAKRQMMPS